LIAGRFMYFSSEHFSLGWFLRKAATLNVAWAVAVAAVVGAVHADEAPTAETARARYRRCIKAGEYAKALEAAKDFTTESEAEAEAGAVATGYVLQAICHEKLGEATLARSARDSAVRVLENADALPESTQVSNYCALARCSCDLGDHEAAVALAAKASALCSRCGEEAAVDLIDRLNRIAGRLNTDGHAEDAASVYRAALTAVQKRFKEGDTKRAEQFETVAEFYEEQSRHGDAARLREAALSEVEKAHGPGHLLTAAFIAIAASSQSKIGDHAKAESMARRALGITVAAKGEQSIEAGTMMDLLASVCVKRGKWQEAEELSKKAIAAAEAVYGVDALEVCEFRRSLANLCLKQGRYRDAEILVRKSLTVVEQCAAAGSEEQVEDLIFCVGALAALQSREGRHDDAELSWRRAVELAQKLRGQRSALAAELGRRYALTCLSQGRYEAAEALCQQAVDISLEVKGQDHPSTSVSLMTLAEVQAGRGKWPDAVMNVEAGMRSLVKHVRANLASLAPAEQMRVVRGDLTCECATALSIGLLQRESLSIRESSASWLANSKAIGHELSVRSAGKKARSGDGMLLEGGTDLPDGVKLWVDAKTLRKHVPHGSVFVDIARFDYEAFDSKWEGDEDENARYAAWIVPPQGKEVIEVIDLGEASAIDELVAAYRATLLAALGENGTIAITGEAAAEAALKSAAKPLADKVLQPILARIRGSGFSGALEEVIVSPDGELWLVPWAALPLDDGRYLVEQYSITTVTSARDLLHASKSPSEGTAPLIFADPLFKLSGESLSRAVEAMSEEAGSPITPDEEASSIVSLGMRSLGEMSQVSRLPGSLSEARQVMKKIERVSKEKAVAYLQAKALEERVKRVRSPRILHFATHGFTLPDQVVSGSLREEMNPSSVDGRSIQGLTSATGELLEDPLLRCGLLLTGCNLSATERPQGVEDGCLTGKEIVELDLTGTDLVVLSACETGLGRVQYGEGVAGLRQAFLIAGANAVLATLWQVPDGPTAELIGGFFDHLASGHGKARALRQAQLDLIEKRRKAVKAAHPAAWAAFELTGR
jgi:CHAT domain-containing protein/tetratricopeptide (TPR) repeat protein